MAATPDFHQRDLSPLFGTAVEGLDLGKGWDEAVMAGLVDLLHRRGVLVIKGQNLTRAQYVDFGHCWGKPLEFFIAEHRGREFPELITISNAEATPPAMRDGAVHWHSDSSYEEVPGAVTMLYGVEAPLEGGVTLFASSAAAFDALPLAERQRLEGLTAIHELGAAPWIDGETPPDPDRPPSTLPRQRHPLVISHPVTGRKSLFTSGTAFAIEGMDAEAGRALIHKLRSHIASPEFRMDYKVEAGDIVLWDNFLTVHSATPIEYSDAPGKRRLLLRISTKGLPDIRPARFA